MEISDKDRLDALEASGGDLRCYDSYYGDWVVKAYDEWSGKTAREALDGLVRSERKIAAGLAYQRGWEKDIEENKKLILENKQILENRQCLE